MNMTRDRLASIGWVSILAFAGAVTGGLMFRVNAVKSEVQLAERRIVELQRQKEMLETEYETRANQQQLSETNELYFGYKAPNAGQYLESERQLAALGMPAAPGAPSPILMAMDDQRAGGDGASDSDAGAGGRLRAMVSPLIGKAQAAEPEEGAVDRAIKSATTGATLGERLGHVRHHGAHHADAGEDRP